MRFPARYLAALLMLLAASLFAACGGDGEEEEAARDKIPEETAAEEVALAPAEAFAKLQSYRIDLRFTLEGRSDEGPGLLAANLEGSFVAPDRSWTQVSGRLDDLELEEESITIGDQTWVTVDGNWVDGEAQFALRDLSPGSLLEELEADQLRLLKPSRETVNGVKSLRYSIDRGHIEALRSLGALIDPDEGLENLPKEFDIDIWLAEDGGWPVRVTMTARGAVATGDEISLDFSLDITDVNDPDIKIEPPEV